VAEVDRRDRSAPALPDMAELAAERKTTVPEAPPLPRRLRAAGKAVLATIRMGRLFSPDAARGPKSPDGGATP
jgi:hypothetical protein